MDPLYKNQIDFLDKCIKNNTLSHAYLFYGNSKIKEFALEFVSKINCKGQGEKPCHNCQSCRDFDNKIFSDLKLIEPLSQDSKGNQKKGNEILIDQIRDAQYFASLTSMNDCYKVVIIDYAHYLNQEAQNALLKILEEPNKRVIFILISEYPDILLETILSRCTKIFFPFLEQEITEQDKKYIKDIKDLMDQNMAQRFAYAKALFPGKDKSGELSEAKRLLQIWLMFFRNALLEQSGAKNILNQEIFQMKKIRYPTKKIFSIIKKIQMVLGSLDFTNVSQKLSFEIILLEL
ncbi:MAG TPA: AAA family ATPase [Candidatus Pacearchaeota archaeon]|nr:AAA family ATPase [Candidatus Pacearchaeota archaeon]